MSFGPHEHAYGGFEVMGDCGVCGQAEDAEIHRRPKAEDVPAERLLEVIAACNEARCTIGAVTGSWHGGRAGYAEGEGPERGHPCKVIDICASLPEFPEKVIRAKLRRLVSDGRISGCTCGCRGDFEVC